MRALILGCGVVGTLVGNRLLEQGWTVVGMRRTPWGRDAGDPVPGFPVVQAGGSPANPGTAGGAWVRGVLPPQAILVAANPGIRRGRDNGVAVLISAAHQAWPSARLVLVSTTSLYGDADGQGVAENGPLGTDAESQALRAIELAAEAQTDHLILRATALVGPTRTFARTRAQAARAAGTPLVIKGDPDRPFSYLHDDDLAELVASALAGGLGRGLLNAAAPHRLTVRAYYEAAAGGPITILGDGSAQPRRWIDASRLWRQWPDHPWRR